MGKYNLNDDSYDAKDVAIFNDGEAGKALNVEISKIEKKTTDGNQPDWKIYFKDSSGNEISHGLYYVDTTREYGEKKWISQGKLLKHLVHQVMGADAKLPEFDTTEEGLDKVMSKLAKSIDGVKLNVWCNYGTENKSSEYLRIRSFAPMMEPAATAEEDSKLKRSKIEVMSRITADAEPEVEEVAEGSEGDW
ncbi:MAG TPA: hypothetical protein DCY51_07495 [Bacteroidetes bacterium]|nr:hypothetical protein [Bacteroidota bacterium]